ncbi:pyrimidine reductase family protein [Paeniglutamicibacter cryotolerans]|uniref:Riboflavin biosynthesis pyrimidine reductase n=1 Tax=Paeniglutamicibacter cryotolerans TaxID=670079 RepID=A0A839QJK3_9MICC|nr:pyrimidine reductase family protein [Paeniglutamicibacter cryotolerans]MBB2996588.1 riboflavin biosynthesis pyrimidine reductase [Paeniglutamicibacter cryotolerans]
MLNRLYPATATATAVDDETLLHWYAPPAGSDPFVRFNFVSSLDGSATHAGLSGALGGPGDKRVFSLLRRHAEVILVGAGTIRAEGYAGELLDAPGQAWRASQGMAAHPRLAVVSGSLDLDPDGELFSASPHRVLVLGSPGAAAARRRALSRVAEVIDCPTDGDELTPAGIVAVLSGLGLRMIHSEGGPRLFASFQGAGLVDSLCLSLAPKLAGGSGRRIASGPSRPELIPLSLRLLLEQDGELLAEYRRP